jgi:hypothetical protein
MTITPMTILDAAVLVALAADLFFERRFVAQANRIREDLGNYLVEFERKVRRFEKSKDELQRPVELLLHELDPDRDTLREFRASSPSLPPIPRPPSRPSFPPAVKPPPEPTVPTLRDSGHDIGCLRIGKPTNRTLQGI